jgi:hypothetical protein
MRKQRSDKGKKRRPYKEYAVLGLSGIAVPSLLYKSVSRMTEKKNILKNRVAGSVNLWYTRAEAKLKTALRGKLAKEVDFNDAVAKLREERRQALKWVRETPAENFLDELNAQKSLNRPIYTYPIPAPGKDSILNLSISSKKSVLDKLKETADNKDFISTYQKLRLSPHRVDRQITNTSRLVKGTAPLLGLGLVGAGYYTYKNLQKKDK